MPRKGLSLLQLLTKKITGAITGHFLIDLYTPILPIILPLLIDTMGLSYFLAGLIVTAFQLIRLTIRILLLRRIYPVVIKIKPDQIREFLWKFQLQTLREFWFPEQLKPEGARFQSADPRRVRRSCKRHKNYYLHRSESLLIAFNRGPAKKLKPESLK